MGPGNSEALAEVNISLNDHQKTKEAIPIGSSPIKQVGKGWCFGDTGQVAHVKSYQGYLEAHLPLSILSGI